MWLWKTLLKRGWAATGPTANATSASSRGSAMFISSSGRQLSHLSHKVDFSSPLIYVHVNQYMISQRRAGAAA